MMYFPAMGTHNKHGKSYTDVYKYKVIEDSITS
jgi:hypothetical protein